MSNNSMVVYETQMGQIELNSSIVRQVIAKGDDITDAEVYAFIQLCKYRKLNPFLGEAHLVKFSGKCSQIVGLSVFQKRLNNNPKNEGFELGVITIDDKNVIHEREGTFFPSEIEKLVGAYIILYKKGNKPLKWTINLKDYQKIIIDKYTKKERPQGQWQTMPAVMITKCCFVAGVRYFYPEEFSGMYSADEMGIDENEIIEIVEPINQEQIDQLKEISKDEKYKYDDEKLIEYVLNKCVDENYLENSNIEDIPVNKFENIKKLIEKYKNKKIRELNKKEQIEKELNKKEQSEKEQSEKEQIEKEQIEKIEAEKIDNEIKEALSKKVEIEDKKETKNTNRKTKKTDDNKEVKNKNEK